MGGQGFSTSKLLLSQSPCMTFFQIFTVNASNGKFYGVLVPHHNGIDFFGKVVRVDLMKMVENSTACLNDWRHEYLDSNMRPHFHGSNATEAIPCVHVLDVQTIHPNARGFRRGFSNYPFAYLAPGDFDVAVRLNMDDFTISTVAIVDLFKVDPTLGGYSGGFADGSWACFT